MEPRYNEVQGDWENGYGGAGGRYIGFVSIHWLTNIVCYTKGSLHRSISRDFIFISLLLHIIQFTFITL